MRGAGLWTQQQQHGVRYKSSAQTAAGHLQWLAIYESTEGGSHDHRNRWVDFLRCVQARHRGRDGRRDE